MPTDSLCPTYIYLNNTLRAERKNPLSSKEGDVCLISPKPPSINKRVGRIPTTNRSFYDKIVFKTIKKGGVASETKERNLRKSFISYRV